MHDKIAFVILHYCALTETLACIESIEKNIDVKNYLIVIVDNGSPNHTGEALVKLYGKKKNCKIILNNSNLGFAKGNNVGFRFAKAQGAKFICMMNSDTCIIDKNFGEQIWRDYNKYHYYVLGPDIILKQSETRVNPLGEHILKKNEIRYKVISLNIQIALVWLHFGSIVDKIRKIKKTNMETNVYKRNNYYRNVKLHGCCLIFSPDYIEEYDGINDKTFLYLEEDMLYLEMRKKNYLMLYSPKVHIFHAEDASSNYIKQGRKKRLFILKSHLRSLIAIYKTIKELDKESK